MYALRIGDSSGHWTEFPLMAPAASPELLKISSAGCLKEDGRYQLRLVTDSADAIDDMSIVVDGEEVARGLTGAAAGYRDVSGTLLYVYEPALIGDRSGADGQILLLIYGFARIEVSLTLANGGVLYLESDDISVLVRGDRELETARVEGMFDALFSAPPTRPLQWMLTGMPAVDERFSIVEGGAVSATSRSVSTFLQVTDQVLSGFEHYLGSFRSHVRSSISEVPTRVPGDKVRVAGAREASWIASHPHLLQRSRVESGIRLGSGFYMPRYVQTGQRTHSYDTYENRAIVSFLSVCGQRLGRLASLVESESGVSESVERALNHFAAEGYVLSSLLIATSSHRRGELVRERAEALRRKAAALEHAYGLAVPGVKAGKFLPPRRSKVFQEVEPYTQLYELMMRWCTMGDLDMRGSMLALRTARMDRFYEYFVLLTILTKLDECGFEPSGAVERPIEVVEYSLGARSRFYKNEKQVANKYVLERDTKTVTLYYQPVIYGDAREENGIRLHRTSVDGRGYDSYYTPDYLLVFESEGRIRTVVIDAKYRYVRGVLGGGWPRSAGRPQHGDTEGSQRGAAEDPQRGAEGGSRESEFEKCLRKYRLEVSGVFGPPDAVWLLCGRDAEVETRYWEQSSWTQTEARFLRSGAMTLTPMGDDLDSLFEAIGIIELSDVFSRTDELSEINELVVANRTIEVIKPRSEAREQRNDYARPAESVADESSKNELNAMPNDVNDSENDDSSSQGVELKDDAGVVGDVAPSDEMQKDASTLMKGRGRDSDEKDSESEICSKCSSSVSVHNVDNALKTRKGTKGARKTEAKVSDTVAGYRGASTEVEKLVSQLYRLLGQSNHLLFDDQWSRMNIGLGRPVLRKGKPLGKEVIKYGPLSLDGDEVYLAKSWTKLNVNKAIMLIRRLEEKGAREG